MSVLEHGSANPTIMFIFCKFKKFVFLTHFLDPRQFRLGPSPKVAFFFGIPLFTEFLL